MIVIFCLCLLCVGAFADSVTGNFNLDISLNPIPSQGSVTFTLNGDGTIAAMLSITNGATIVTFGFNSLAGNLPESNFSPTLPDSTVGTSDGFGIEFSGFRCTTCGTNESWTIDGSYSSVFDVLNGGNLSLVDFFLVDSNLDHWGANATVVTTPDPGTISLMFSGMLGWCLLVGMKQLRRNPRASEA
jgi:hypothetical protein